MAITRKTPVKKPVAKAIIKASPVEEVNMTETKTVEVAEERVEVMIMKSSDKFAIDPVPVTVNGYCIAIRRGEWVKVPKPYIEALNHAVETHFDQVKDPDTGGMMMRTREAHSYPYQTR